MDPITAMPAGAYAPAERKLTLARETLRSIGADLMRSVDSGTFFSDASDGKSDGSEDTDDFFNTCGCATMPPGCPDPLTTTMAAP